MTDPTVVNLCRQYLQTKNLDVLRLLCDRLEELGDEAVERRREWFFQTPTLYYNSTVPYILKQYGGEP